MAHDYDVALSFAGEDREVAQALALELRGSGLRIFFDEFEQAFLWGKNLYDYLAEIYSNKAMYCLMILSENYARKAWPNHERQHAQARAFSESREYILPVRLDDTEIPGIPSTVGYLDLRRSTPAEVAELLHLKIKAQSHAGLSGHQCGGNRASLQTSEASPSITESDSLKVLKPPQSTLDDITPAELDHRALATAEKLVGDYLLESHVVARIMRSLAESSAWGIILDLSFHKRAEHAQAILKPFGLLLFNNVAFSEERLERWHAALTRFSLERIVYEEGADRWYVRVTGATWTEIAESVLPILCFVFRVETGHRFHFAYID